MTTPSDSETGSASFGSSRVPVLVIAFFVLAWRFAALPIGEFARDVLAILAVFAVVTCIELRPRIRSTIVVGVAILLLCLYVVGQFPNTLLVLGLKS